jgi:branched-chain amino acid transport system permease protein
VVLTTSVDALLMAVLGGAGTLVGGVIGAFIVIALREYLSTLVPWWQYVLGAVYVLTILYLPSGLMGIPQRIRQRKGAPGDRNRGEKAGTGAVVTAGRMLNTPMATRETAL